MDRQKNRDRLPHGGPGTRPPVHLEKYPSNFPWPSAKCKAERLASARCRPESLPGRIADSALPSKPDRCESGFPAGLHSLVDKMRPSTADGWEQWYFMVLRRHQ